MYICLVKDVFVEPPLVTSNEGQKNKQGGGLYVNLRWSGGWQTALRCITWNFCSIGSLYIHH